MLIFMKNNLNKHKIYMYISAFFNCTIKNCNFFHFLFHPKKYICLTYKIACKAWKNPDISAVSGIIVKFCF